MSDAVTGQPSLGAGAKWQAVLPKKGVKYDAFFDFHSAAEHGTFVVNVSSVIIVVRNG